jgi:SAM-dependent methyltransferase
MVRPRTIALALAAGAAGAAVVRHRVGHQRGHDVPGGVLMGDVGGYDRYAGLLLRSFYSGVASDVGATVARGARVLEIGCGPGRLSVLLARRHGLDVTGVDLDPAMIDRARANADRASALDERRPSFEVADAAALPFDDASFDAVVSTLSMHHWADPGAGLAEIARVLRPGGPALIWELRPGGLPLHRHVPDPTAHLRGSSLALTGVTAWRWPWNLTLTQRIGLERR